MAWSCLSAHLRRSSTVIVNPQMWKGIVLPGLCGGFRRGKSVASESEEAEADLVGVIVRLLANANGI